MADTEVSEKQAYRKAKKKHELLKERRDEELRAILQLYEGRAFIWWLLEEAGIYQTTFSEVASMAAFREGMRQMGLRLLERMNEVDPNAYSQLQREAVQRKERGE